MALDNYENIVGREKLVQFVKIGEMTDYAVHGNGIQDLALAYEDESNTYKWVTSKNGTEIVSGYQISLDQEQYVQSDNPVFKEINKLRKALDTTTQGKLLTVEVFTGDIDTVTTAPAEEMTVGLKFSSYGGSSDSPLTIGYTFTSVGTPKIGVATFTRLEGKTTVAFEEKAPTGE